MKLCLVLIGLGVLLLLCVPIGAAMAKSRITAGEPVPYEQLRSLRQVIEQAENGRVHIVYVHGMRAEKPGASAAFRARLTRSLGGVAAQPTRKVLNLQPWPEEAMVGTRRIWDREEDWNKGQPFIDRYAITTRGGATITVDEVNWWPLVFPLKCRMLLEPEALVAGVDRPHLELCHRDEPPYHRWISDADYQRALASRPALGGAASANKYLKLQILDWGLSDAVIATGPMRVYLNAAMDEAFAYAAEGRATSEYVVISESLGSFVVLDAYAEDKPGVRDVLNATHNLYFLANQFALLELARVRGLPVEAVHREPGRQAPAALAPGQVQQQRSPFAALADWATAPAPVSFLKSEARVKQIIAFSDPSDALTYRVPEFRDAAVSNVYVRNTASLLGLFASPVRAHSAHMKNERLWHAMLDGK